MARLYLLFVHYRLSSADQKLILEPGSTYAEIVTNLGMRVAKDLKYLNSLLSGRDGWRGEAFVFFDIGWAKLVRRTLEPEDSAVIGRAISYLERYLDGQNVLNRIRLISIADLVDFTNKLRNSGIGRFFAGTADVLYYDAPKIVEAIIRIANFGRHVPLFRFDDDVLFSGARIRGSSSRSNFHENLLRLCKHYDDLSEDPDINYFAFSGGYIDPKSERKFQKKLIPKDNMFHTHTNVNGFATRLLSLASIQEASMISPEIDISKAVKFLNDLVKVGANPFAQVISGAGFCLSDGAILDLPPFSNMRQNVVWIDDHLKYALHHELGHFGYEYGTRQVGRVRDAWFPQHRYGDSPTFDDAKKEVWSYLPRLVLGCIADSWLRSTPKIKVRLSAQEFKKAMGLVPGVFGQAFKKYVGSGLNRNDRQKVGTELWRTAEKRMNEVIHFFSKFEGTYLEAFVDGDDIGVTFPNVARQGLRTASYNVVWSKVPDFSRTVPLSTEPTLRESTQALVSDFLDYIEFVRNWKEAVFASRLLLNSRDHGARFLGPLARTPKRP